MNDNQNPNQEQIDQINANLKAMAEPLAQMVYQESISGKCVVSGLTSMSGDGNGPYWTIFVCLEHMSGVQTMPVTLGRYYPDLDNDFMQKLQMLGNVIVIRERDRFTEAEALMIKNAFTDLLTEKMEEIKLTSNPGEYFDACYAEFPCEKTEKDRKDFVASQTRMASKQPEGEAAGA